MGTMSSRNDGYGRRASGSPLPLLPPSLVPLPSVVLGLDEHATASARERATKTAPHEERGALRTSPNVSDENGGAQAVSHPLVRRAARGRARDDTSAQEDLGGERAPVVPAGHRVAVGAGVEDRDLA